MSTPHDFEAKAPTTPQATRLAGCPVCWLLSGIERTVRAIAYAVDFLLVVLEAIAAADMEPMQMPRPRPRWVCWLIRFWYSPAGDALGTLLLISAWALICTAMMALALP